MKFVLPRLALVLVALVAAVVSGRAAESAVDLVLRADQARLSAMMAGDGATLNKLMSDDLSFVHSDGRVETKREYVKNMLAGDTAYADAKTSDLQTKQIAPDVVILIGAQDMRKKLGPTWSEIKLKFLAVWRNEAGTWRLVAWQSMRPAGNSVVPSKK